MENVTIKEKAIFVSQRPGKYHHIDDYLNLYDFFVFSLSSKKLLDIAKFTSRSESKLGVQRTHVEERDRQIGQFICSDHPFFPNTIIINFREKFSNDFFDNKTNELNITTEKKTAYVIDGQHRLKAFTSKYSEGVHLDMVVVAYFGLELPTVAEIFTRINFYQKPVNKSLVYDLLDFNKDPEFSKFKEGHKVIDTLNNKVGSPFYGLIKMLGVGPGLLSQAAAVEAFTVRYKILNMLEGKYNFDQKIEIIENYFNKIKDEFGGKWNNKESTLSRTVGFNALTKTLMLILSHHLGGDDLCKIDFKKYAKEMALVNVDDDEITSYGGFKGVNTLAQKFEEKLFARGLL